MSTVFADEKAQLTIEGNDPRPLSDDEIKLLQRLLSDPFSIPQPFKTWLISFLEGSDLLLPRSSVQGLSLLLGSGGGSGIMGLLPAGIMFEFGGSVAPEGTVLCDGKAYARAGQYNRLFKAIGLSWQTTADANSFNVPDTRRRVPWHAGVSVGVGANDGQAESARTLDHHHGFSQTSNPNGTHSHGGQVVGVGDHSHPLPGLTGQSFNMNPITNASIAFLQGIGSGNTHGAGGHSHTINPDGSHTHVVSGDTQGGGLLNRPAFYVCAHIINY